MDISKFLADAFKEKRVWDGMGAPGKYYHVKLSWQRENNTNKNNFV